MIYHNLRASFKPDVTQEQQEAVVERLREQGRVIGTVTSVGVGQDYGGEFTHAALFGFNDLESYRAYLTHPFHRETDALVLPLVGRLDDAGGQGAFGQGHPGLLGGGEDVHVRRQQVGVVEGAHAHEGDAGPAAAVVAPQRDVAMRASCDLLAGTAVAAPMTATAFTPTAAGGSTKASPRTPTTSPLEVSGTPAMACMISLSGSGNRPSHLL